jgi:hypothetical protein
VVGACCDHQSMRVQRLLPTRCASHHIPCLLRTICPSRYHHTFACTRYYAATTHNDLYLEFYNYEHKHHTNQGLDNQEKNFDINTLFIIVVALIVNILPVWILFFCSTTFNNQRKWSKMNLE